MSPGLDISLSPHRWLSNTHVPRVGLPRLSGILPLVIFTSMASSIVTLKLPTCLSTKTAPYFLATWVSPRRSGRRMTLHMRNIK